MFSFAAISITVLAQLSTVKTLTVSSFVSLLSKRERKEREEGTGLGVGGRRRRRRGRKQLFQTLCTSSWSGDRNHEEKIALIRVCGIFNTTGVRRQKRNETYIIRLVRIPFLTSVSANTDFLQPYNGLNGQLQSMQGAMHLRIPHLAIKHSVMGQCCHLSMFQTYPCSCFTVDSASLPSSSSLLSSPSSSSSSASSPHCHRHYHHHHRHHQYYYCCYFCCCCCFCCC